MKFTILLIFLLLMGAASAKYSPALEMAGDITMNSYNITGLPSGDASGDAYTFGQSWLKLNKSGDTMSGPLAMGSQKITGLANGTATGDAYNFGQSWLKMNKSGDTMSGPLAMGGQKVTGLASGTASGDAATFGQSWLKLNKTDSVTAQNVQNQTVSYDALVYASGTEVIAVYRNGTIIDRGTLGTDDDHVADQAVTGADNGVLEFGVGTFKVSLAVDDAGPFIIRGRGSDTILATTGNNTGVINVSGSGGWYDNFNINNIHFKKTTGDTGTCGISTDTSFVSVRNCQFQDLYDGFKVTGSGGVFTNIDNCVFGGVTHFGANMGGSSHASTISNSQFMTCTGTISSSAGSLRVSGCDFETSTNGMIISGANAAIINNHFESNTLAVTVSANMVGAGAAYVEYNYFGGDTESIQVAGCDFPGVFVRYNRFVSCTTPINWTSGVYGGGEFSYNSALDCGNTINNWNVAYKPTIYANRGYGTPTCAWPNGLGWMYYSYGLSTTDIAAIPTPSAGLQAFNVTTGKMCFYSGTSWVLM